MNDKMRIQFVNTATLPPLGADTWIHVQIMRHLDRSTHELYAACATGSPDSPTPTYEALRQIPDLQLMRVDFGPELWYRSPIDKVKTMFKTVPAAVSVLRLGVHLVRRRVAVIHTSDRPRDALVCVLLAKLTRRPAIVQVHQMFSSWTSPLLRWSLRHADGLIAVSDFVGQSLVAGGIRPDRVHVVLNSIDPGRWAPGRGREAVRAEFGVAEDAPVLVTVCRLFPEKGSAEMIKAVAALRDEFPSIRLLIAGTDVTPENQFSTELRRLVAEHGVEEHVVFIGRRHDIEGLMAAADVYAMPSHEEPFGLVFLEAMAMHLPVVALSNGGTLEVVEHGSSGLLSERGDIDMLVTNLRKLLRDPELRERMGEYGRRQVEQRFSGERMAADVARVYSLVA